MFRTYEKSLRLFAVPFIFIYGIVKPWQFEGAFSSTSTPTNELDGMALMWAFFGYSYTVPIVVGCFECTGAVLLVFDRTKLLGALLLLPVLSNIVLFDLVYNVWPFPTINGIFYLGIVLFVCYIERGKLKKAAAQLLIRNEHRQNDLKFSIGRVFTMIAFLTLNFLLFVLCQYLGMQWLSP